tara:strand:+ start:510 stop:809 length:300 start_codon:yes stop_codon:yes gene_type:complete
MVHVFPSSQAALLGACWQPATGSHQSVVQGFESSQFSTTDEMQMPLSQLSWSVQALESLQVVVFGLKRQPVCGEQLSSVQGFESLQIKVLAGVQLPSTQ